MMPSTNFLALGNVLNFVLFISFSKQTMSSLIISLRKIMGSSFYHDEFLICYLGMGVLYLSQEMQVNESYFYTCLLKV